MKRMLTVSSAGLIVALAFGAALVASGRSTIGWWFVLSGVIGSAVLAVAVLRGQRSLGRATQSWDDAVPGRVSSRRSATAGESDAAFKPRRWVGSASVPGSMGYVEIGVLLAVAEVRQHLLVLRVRPALIRLMFGIDNLTVVPDDGAVIFPAHKFGQEGIEIRLNGRPSYYFWTGQRHDLLASAAAAGFEVSAEEQRMRR